MFSTFIDQLTNRLQQPLPGEEVQFLMAPVARIRPEQIPAADYHPRKSAVLILLFPVNDTIRMVLIERPVYEGVHSGQIALPGGKFEEKDADLQQTALRETFEEIGVPSGDITIIGKLSDIYINPSNFLVSPFVGYCPRQPEFIGDQREVQSIFTTDVIALSRDAGKAIKTITHSSGYKIKTPYFEIEGFTVWGATAMIISELNAVVREALLIS